MNSIGYCAQEGEAHQGFIQDWQMNHLGKAQKSSFAHLTCDLLQSLGVGLLHGHSSLDHHTELAIHEQPSWKYCWVQSQSNATRVMLGRVRFVNHEGPQSQLCNPILNPRLCHSTTRNASSMARNEVRVAICIHFFVVQQPRQHSPS